MAEGFIAIGDLARRSGVAASALRFYEAQGLIAALRQGEGQADGQRRSQAGGRRHFPRSTLRRVAFIRAAQAVGLSLEEIKAALAGLPDARTPTREDWAALSRSWRPLIEARITALCRLRDALASCIGCGCLSLEACALYNPADAARRGGAGARYLLGDAPATGPAAAAETANDPVS